MPHFAVKMKYSIGDIVEVLSERLCQNNWQAALIAFREEKMNRDFLELIKTRRSTRRFKPDPVPENLLDAVLEAGTYAPTGMNRQSPVIIAVSDKNTARSSQN